MKTKRSTNSIRTKNFGLAACAILALGVMTASEAAAQHRHGDRNVLNGYSSGQAGYGNNYNSRFNSGYSNYGVSGHRGHSKQRPPVLRGHNYNTHRNARFSSGYGSYGVSRYNTGRYTNRSGYGNNYSGNSQQPVAYRHRNHVDVETSYGRQHLTGRGF